MQIEINKKEYPIYFGLDALSQLDKYYPVEAQGVNLNMAMGQGINVLTIGLVSENPVSVRDFIKAGTNTLLHKPSNNDIEEYIAVLIEDGKLGEFCEGALEELKKQRLTKAKVKQVLDNIQAEQEVIEKTNQPKETKAKPQHSTEQ